MRTRGAKKSRLKVALTRYYDFFFRKTCIHTVVSYSCIHTRSGRVCERSGLGHAWVVARTQRGHELSGACCSIAPPVPVLLIWATREAKKNTKNNETLCGLSQSHIFNVILRYKFLSINVLSMILHNP